ncbi:MAG: thiopurine S-methyltransferase [Gallionellaceae bacterium]
MEKSFWLERWQRGEIGFHEADVNQYLLKHWQALNVPKGKRVFVPLCGKSYDMRWLRQQGYSILGVELSHLAVQDFFAEAGHQPQRHAVGEFEYHQADDIGILCGDFFHLKRDDLQDVAAVYDRASMVALPPEMRERYVQHLVKTLPRPAQILLITFDYPQSEMEGPPFAVSFAEVKKLYGDYADIQQLAQIDVLDANSRFKQRGMTRLQEVITLLTLR